MNAGAAGRFRFWPAINFKNSTRLAKETHRKERLGPVIQFFLVSSVHFWSFPEMGLPPNQSKSSIYKRIVHYEPSILGYPH